MNAARRPLAHGLSLSLRSLPALLWTYFFNFAIALVFSIRFHAQLSSILSHSLASQSLTSAFDLGTVASLFIKLDEGPGGGPFSPYLGVPVYLVVYFLLVPGILFCFVTGSPARLSTLFGEGIRFFWRFVRITLLTLLTSAILLGPLFAAQRAWVSYLDEHVLGVQNFILRHISLALILIFAALIRLYFDLVEVYTVQLGQQLRPNGRPDRRVRRTLRPAWRTLRSRFFANWFSFVLLSALGLTAFVLLTRVAIHSLAQPRSWPIFLSTQLGLFLLLFSRFWQRGFESSLALAHPILDPAATPPPPPRARFYPAAPPPQEPTPHPGPTPGLIPDPIPEPEPPAPSLPQPDPGVFHHDVSTPDLFDK